VTKPHNFGPRQTLIFFLAAFALAFLAPAFVTGWNWSVLKPLAQDAPQAKVQLWAVSISLQAIFWLCCGIYLAYNWQRLRRSSQFGQAARDAILAYLVPGSILLVVVIVTVMHKAELPPSDLGGRYHITNLRLFGSTGMVIVGIALWQMFVTRALLLRRWSDLASTSAKIECMLEFRKSILWLLFVAALILALGTLAGATLAGATNAFAKETFPGEYPVVYGAWYSLLLIVVYFPVQGTYLLLARDVLKDLIGEAPSEIEALQKWSDSSAKLQEILGMDVTKTSMLGPALSTLLPLICGWISKMVAQ
jgi:hypothetical protein